MTRFARLIRDALIQAADAWCPENGWKFAAQLGLTLAGAVIATGFGTTANAASPGPPWVRYKDLPDPASCNSAGYYFEQQGIIKDYLCDEVVPPSAFAAGDTQLWVIF